MLWFISTNIYKLESHLNGEGSLTTALGSNKKCFWVAVALLEPARLIVTTGNPICNVQVSMIVLTSISAFWRMKKIENSGLPFTWTRKNITTVTVDNNSFNFCCWKHYNIYTHGQSFASIDSQATLHLSHSRAMKTLGDFLFTILLLFHHSKECLGSKVKG